MHFPSLVQIGINCFGWESGYGVGRYEILLLISIISIRFGNHL